jgi:hypothetical protein
MALMPEQLRKPEVGFGLATVVFAVIGVVLCIRFPEPPMLGYGGIIALTSLMPVLFYFMHRKQSHAKQMAGLASLIIWVGGIGLAFVIPKTSKFIFVPDALLMLGFFPLLYLWKYSIPWIVFGALNFGIGILLLVIQFSPDNLFPPELLTPKHHLADYHPSVVWYCTGMMALAFGICRLAKNLYLMMRKARSAA